MRDREIKEQLSIRLPIGWVDRICQIAEDERKRRKGYQQKIYPHSTYPVEKSEVWVNVGGNVPNVVLERGIFQLQRGFNLITGVDDCGMISAKFFADLRKT